MKTLTIDNEWYEFSMKDIPTHQNLEQFVLMNKFSTPILKSDSIMRGDIETGLFEGDVILHDGEEWLVCYERGFYVINRNYFVKHLYSLDKFEVIGRCTEFKGFPPISFKKKYLFKHRNTCFKLSDIAGAYEGKVLLRSIAYPISTDSIQQDCSLRYNKEYVYLGDKINNSSVALRGGRITIKSDTNEIIDVSTGGVLNGYIPRNIRRS